MDFNFTIVYVLTKKGLDGLMDAIADPAFKGLPSIKNACKQWIAVSVATLEPVETRDLSSCVEALDSLDSSAEQEVVFLYARLIVK